MYAYMHSCFGLAGIPNAAIQFLAYDAMKSLLGV